MFTRICLLEIAVLGAVLAGAQLALAEQTQMSVPAFGARYMPVASVSERQAQVVYFRPGSLASRAGAAHVYVDREFHAGLLPGGFSSFCVAPGQHSLGAYLNDAPYYKGKSTEVYSAELAGGKTYFLEVREDGYGAPLAITREDAERKLRSMRAQVQAVSRASMNQPCDYLPMASTTATSSDQK